MDGRDAQLVAALLRCCRTPLEDVASTLGISIAAIHKRLVTMEESGLIRKHRALVNPSLLGGQAWYVRASSRSAPTVDLADTLGAHPDVFQVILLSHRKIGITAVFRGDRAPGAAHPLPAFEQFLRSKSVVPEASRELELPVRHDTVLDETTCRVLEAMAYDARRPLSWLAQKSQLPTRKVSAVVDRLIRDGSVIFTMDLSTGAGSGTWAELEVEGPSAQVELCALSERSPCRLLWLTPFLGRARWYAWFWCESAGGLQALVDSLAARGSGVDEAGVILSTHGYPVWLHDEVVRGAHGAATGKP